MLTRLFPLFAVLLSIVAYAIPTPFVLCKPAITPLLGIVMFGMGLSLEPADFARVAKAPKPILLGIILQFSIMPMLAWLLAKPLQLSPDLFIGMLLVGACSGGTASNVICYLSRGNVALSISLTSLSTLMAVFATPLLTLIYAGKSIEVPALKMLLDIVKVIILPVALGLLLNKFLPHWTSKFRKYSPAVSVAAIIFIIAIVVAINNTNILKTGPLLLTAVALHNLLGLLTGYYTARLLSFDHVVAKTLAIEVGMQNSGLAVLLATKHFSMAAALPGALFSIWHNISGSILAAYWSKKSTKELTATDL